jgi:two-component system nitrate/nitrite response regulator NarL
VKILIVEDDPVYRGVLREKCREVVGLEALPLAAATNRKQADELLEQDYDIAFIALKLDGDAGLSLDLVEKASARGTKVVVVSGDYSPDTMGEAARCGAWSFIPKNLEVEQIAAVLRLILTGHPYFPGFAGKAEKVDDPLGNLTRKEVEVLDLAAEGHRNKSIARLRGVAENTVKQQMRGIFTKLGVRNRTQAAVKRNRKGRGK